MKPYPIDFREKIVKAYQRGNTSIRKVAERFEVSKGFVQKLLKQQQLKGDLQPGKQGGGLKSSLAGHETQLMAMVEQYPDASLAEYCQESDPQGVSICTMCRELKKLQLTRKKMLHIRHLRPNLGRADLLVEEFYTEDSPRLEFKRYELNSVSSNCPRFSHPARLPPLGRAGLSGHGHDEWLHWIPGFSRLC